MQLPALIAPLFRNDKTGNCGFPLLTPIAYYVIDWVFEWAVVAIWWLLLSGSAFKFWGVLLVAHQALICVTDYGEPMPIGNAQLVPASVMKSVDWVIVLAFLSTPFFLSGFGSHGGAFFVALGVIAIPLQNILDSQPYAKGGSGPNENLLAVK